MCRAIALDNHIHAVKLLHGMYQVRHVSWAPLQNLTTMTFSKAWQAQTLWPENKLQACLRTHAYDALQRHACKACAASRHCAVPAMWQCPPEPPAALLSGAHPAEAQPHVHSPLGQGAASPAHRGRLSGVKVPVWTPLTEMHSCRQSVSGCRSHEYLLHYCGGVQALPNFQQLSKGAAQRALVS